MMVTERKISFDDAFSRLKEKYPEQHNKILCNEYGFKTKLRMMRCFYQREPIPSYFDNQSLRAITYRCDDFFFAEKDYITDFAYEYFCKRIEEFDSLLRHAKTLNNDYPKIVSTLTPITEVCPKTIHTKRGRDKDNRLQLVNLIQQIDYLYIRVPPDTKMTQNNYCWLLGSHYCKERGKKYYFTDEDFLEQYPSSFTPQWGYKSIFEMTGLEDNTKLCRINAECFQVDNDGISVKKVFINNDIDISIYCIYGGILTTTSFEPDFFYHLNDSLNIKFEDLYVVEIDAKKQLEQIAQNNQDDFSSLTKDQQRLYVIKYALENSLLDQYLDEQYAVPVCNLTKKELFEFLMNSTELLNKFGDDNRYLFSVDSTEFFKGNEEIKSIIKFKSGRRKKS